MPQQSRAGGVALGLSNVTKVYPDGTCAVDRLSLEVARGELVVLVGPSGSGKTTALRMIAGLEEITYGDMRIGHRLANDIPPHDRSVGMVFQSSALYPHMTVGENLGFPLHLAKVPHDVMGQRVNEVAEMLRIRDHLGRYPGQLSGGERQRVAMGRALIREPAVFLLDEPLSNLDAGLRAAMRTEITSLQRRVGVTTIYVTHDQVEALTMADRVAVLRAGVLQQVGTPQELYEQPQTVFVAAFVGTPSMNLFEAVVHNHRDGRVELDLGPQQLSLADDLLHHAAPLRGAEGRTVVVGLRPEDVRLEDRRQRNVDRLQGRVTGVEFHGHETLLHVDIGARGFNLSASRAVSEAVDEARSDRNGHTAPARARNASEGEIVARLPPTSGLRPGMHVPLALDLRRVHVFDTDGRCRFSAQAVPVG